MRKAGFALAFALVAVVAMSNPASAGEAFFKGGLQVSPTTGLGIGDRWFVGVGSDYNLTEVAFLGFEVQGAYRSIGVVGSTVTSIPANVFVNGKWKMESDQFRPYGGAGLGMVSAIVRTNLLGLTNTTYSRNVGFQFGGGCEFNRKYLVEFNGQKAFQTGSLWAYSLAGGFRW